MALRTIPIRRAGNRHNLFMGGDRELVMFSGLGLSISQELAHLMHGDIAVKSWPGMGSHFIVTLPLQKAAALLAAA